MPVTIPRNPVAAIKTSRLAKVKQVTPRQPLWRGPDIDGITNSLLCKFLVCRERFRLKVVEGLDEDEGFNKSIEYGSMWHEMEEAYCRTKMLPEAEKALRKYTTKLVAKYQGSEAEIHKWSTLCLYQYRIYVKYWEKHSDEKSRKPIFEEVAFKVPYHLPSGRTVLLRGKFDAVFLASISPKEQAAHKVKSKQGMFLQENKTKGEIDEEGILNTVGFNLQTMIYQIALREAHQYQPGLIKQLGMVPYEIPIVGTLYNVIRRPLSDRFAIKQRKGRQVKGKVVGAESQSQFLKRVEAEILSDPDHSFMRWKVFLTKEDIYLFRNRTLDPILEQLWDWWEWIKTDPHDPWRPRLPSECPNLLVLSPDQIISPHFQSPWGVYNSMYAGYRGDYYEWLTKGRDANLVRVPTLFPELEDR